MRYNSYIQMQINDIAYNALCELNKIQTKKGEYVSIPPGVLIDTIITCHYKMLESKTK